MNSEAEVKEFQDRIRAEMAKLGKAPYQDTGYMTATEVVIRNKVLFQMYDEKKIKPAPASESAK